VTGRARHGKDTIGELLVEAYGFRKYAFAAQLKSMALALDPWILGASIDQRVLFLGDDDDMYARLSYIVDQVGWEEAKRAPEVRRFLQVLGTEGVRDHLGDNAWVDALRRHIDSDSDEAAVLGEVPYGIVVTDVRFPNEAQAIRDWGGVIWRVVRVNPDGTPFDNGLGADHPSEAFVDKLVVDTTIRAAHLGELKRKVRQRMEETYAASW
jgi:hypothetical protein